MPTPLTVLHSAETVPGGVGIYLSILAGMPTSEYRQIFLVPASDRDFLPAQDDRFQTYPQRRRGPLGFWQQARNLRRLIRQEKPDILFLHSTFSLFALALLRLTGGPGVPVIYCPHGWAVSRYPAGSFKARVAALIEGRLSGLTDVVVNVSHNDTAIAQSLGYRGHQTTVENAVPPPDPNARDDLFICDDPDAIHLLFVGRLDRQKGVDILLPAFERAHRQRPDLRLHIVGGAVRDKGVPLDYPEGVNPLGWVSADQIDDYYRSADVLVVPSRWEGFGLVVAEALRNGTPVLCSDRGALPDLVAEGETGHVFHLDSSSLTERLVTLDKSSLRAMRPACRTAYDTRFSVDRLFADLQGLYTTMRCQ